MDHDRAACRRDSRPFPGGAVIPSLSPVFRGVASALADNGRQCSPSRPHGERGAFTRGCTPWPERLTGMNWWRKSAMSRAALMAAVLEHPDDDALRLVLADWLEEHGE